MRAQGKLNPTETNAIDPTFSTTTRAHIGLVVGDLEASIAFYSALFEEQPTKQRSDYAKFEPEQPALNLSLSLSKSQDSTPSTAGGHFGVQGKVWVVDPDGNPWEVFVVLDPGGIWAKARLEPAGSKKPRAARSSAPARTLWELLSTRIRQSW